MSDNPAGRVLPLARLQVYGGTPPVALTVWSYNTPTLPFGNVNGVIPSAVRGATANVRGIETGGPTVSVTVTVTGYDPVGAAVIPLIMPVLGSIVNPVGKPVAAHVYGGNPP